MKDNLKEMRLLYLFLLFIFVCHARLNKRVISSTTNLTPNDLKNGYWIFQPYVQTAEKIISEGVTDDTGNTIDSTRSKFKMDLSVYDIVIGTDSMPVKAKIWTEIVKISYAVPRQNSYEPIGEPEIRHTNAGRIIDVFHHDMDAKYGDGRTYIRYQTDCKSYTADLMRFLSGL